MVYDDFECTFKRLHHPSCISFNLAAEGKLCCELLSSDKYSKPMEYKLNKISHHFYTKVRTYSIISISFQKDFLSKHPLLVLVILLFQTISKRESFRWVGTLTKCLWMPLWKRLSGRFYEKGGWKFVVFIVIVTIIVNCFFTDY